MFFEHTEIHAGEARSPTTCSGQYFVEIELYSKRLKIVGQCTVPGGRIYGISLKTRTVECQPIFLLRPSQKRYCFTRTCQFSTTSSNYIHTNFALGKFSMTEIHSWNMNCPYILLLYMWIANIINFEKLAFICTILSSAFIFNVVVLAAVCCFRLNDCGINGFLYIYIYNSLK